MEKEPQPKPKTERRETEPSGLGDVYVFPIESATSLATELATLKQKLQKDNKRITAMVEIKNQLIVNVEDIEKE